MDKLPIEPSIEAGNSFMFSLKARLRDIAKALNPIAAVFDYLVPRRDPTAGGRTGITVDATSPANNAFLILNKGAGPLTAYVQGQVVGVPRWGLILGNAFAETGANAGSDAGIDRYDDAGALIGTPIHIRRSDGRITLGPALTVLTGGQLQFPSLQNASTDPNTLDDYEEGTWTPANGSGVGMTVNFASYTKIGRLVYVTAQVTFAATASGVAITLTGLPFTIGNSGPLSVGYQTSGQSNVTAMATTGNSVNVYVGGAFATYAQFTGAQLYFGGSYQV